MQRLAAEREPHAAGKGSETVRKRSKTTICRAPAAPSTSGAAFARQSDAPQQAANRRRSSGYSSSRDLDGASLGRRIEQRVSPRAVAGVAKHCLGRGHSVVPLAASTSVPAAESVDSTLLIVPASSLVGGLFG
jgi:hypothetical protein